MNKRYDDLLDLLSGQYDEVLTGTYYTFLPKTMTDSGISFQYDIVNDSDHSYSNVLDSLNTELTTCTLKTNDTCAFKVNSYIATQDGKLWQISGVVKKIINERSKQALRLLKETSETIYLIRLIEVPNPWELK